MEIGERIKTLREMHEMSQEELGQRIGVKRAAVQKYEKGTVENIPIKTIEKLAAIFDVHPSFITGWNTKELDLNREIYTIRGVNHFFGKLAVDQLYLFSQLNTTGQKRAVQYLEELQQLYSK